MTKEQEKLLNAKFEKTLREVQFQGVKHGAKGILGAVLNMCNEGKSIGYIKDFCEKSLAMDGMK